MQMMPYLNIQISTLLAEQDRVQDLRLVIGQLEAFAKMVDSSLDQVDWSTKRHLIRTLVKQIEIGGEVVKVVYRIDRLPCARAPEGGLLQHCLRRAIPADGEPVLPSVHPGMEAVRIRTSITGPRGQLR